MLIKSQWTKLVNTLHRQAFDSMLFFGIVCEITLSLSTRPIVSTWTSVSSHYNCSLAYNSNMLKFATQIKQDIEQKVHI